MLIIFDLDDTLVETSKCLTSHRLKFALEQMVAKGLDIGDFSHAFEQLLDINEIAISSREALKEFSERYSDQSEILNRGLEALKSPLPSNVSLYPVPGALELLEQLQGLYILTLVTMGDANLQYQKMKKAGIQQERFSKLVVSNGSSKKPDYQQIILDFAVAPQQVIVVGDRVPTDLTPAKELGCHTVHLQNGRGKIHRDPMEHVDVSIKELSEFKASFVENLLKNLTENKV